MKSTITLPKDPKAGTSLTFRVSNQGDTIEITSPDRSINGRERFQTTIAKGDALEINSMLVDFKITTEGELDMLTEWVIVK